MTSEATIWNEWTKKKVRDHLFSRNMQLTHARQDGKLMVNYRNNGWVYYSQMHQIAPEGGVQGAGTHQGTQAVQDVNVIGSEEDIETGDTDHQSRSAPLPNAEGDASTAGLCLENLLSIASGIMSEDPGKQIAAVHDSVSLFSQVKSQVTSSIVNTNLFQGSKHCTSFLHQFFSFFARSGMGVGLQ